MSASVPPTYQLRDLGAQAQNMSRKYTHEFTTDERKQLIEYMKSL
jgi:hypothetical protein